MKRTLAMMELLSEQTQKEIRRLEGSVLHDALSSAFFYDKNIKTTKKPALAEKRKQYEKD